MAQTQKHGKPVNKDFLGVLMREDARTRRGYSGVSVENNPGKFAAVDAGLREGVRHLNDVVSPRMVGAVSDKMLADIHTTKCKSMCAVAVKILSAATVNSSSNRLELSRKKRSFFMSELTDYRSGACLSVPEAKSFISLLLSECAELKQSADIYLSKRTPHLLSRIRKGSSICLDIHSSLMHARTLVLKMGDTKNNAGSSFKQEALVQMAEVVLSAVLIDGSRVKGVKGADSVSGCIAKLLPTEESKGEQK